MRVPRELVWVVILVAVLAIALLGCSPSDNANESFETAVSEAREDRKSEQAKILEKYKFEMINLHWSPVYLLKFDGHEYLTRSSSSYILHTASCPGVHSE